MVSVSLIFLDIASMNTKWMRLYECFNKYDWQIFKITASLDIDTALNYASLVMEKGIVASQKDLLSIWLVGKLRKYLFLGYLVTLLYLYVIFYRIDFFLSWAILYTVLWVNIFSLFLTPQKAFENLQDVFKTSSSHVLKDLLKMSST